jgi:hypothetical protein
VQLHGAFGEFTLPRGEVDIEEGVELRLSEHIPSGWVDAEFDLLSSPQLLGLTFGKLVSAAHRLPAAFAVASKPPETPVPAPLALLFIQRDGLSWHVWASVVRLHILRISIPPRMVPV